MVKESHGQGDIVAAIVSGRNLSYKRYESQEADNPHKRGSAQKNTVGASVALV